VIYTSTCCLKKPHDLLYVLDEYQKAELEHVELGSVHKYFDVKKLNDYNFDYMIHGYFPPPKTPFNFNLASQNNLIVKKSLNLAKQAIDLCCELNSHFFYFSCRNYN